MIKPELKNIELPIRSALERILQLEEEVRRLQQPVPLHERYIRISQSSRVIKVSLSKVQYIQGESNYSRIFLTTGEQYLTSRTLKSWVTELPAEYLLRCHKSYLINRVEIIEFKRRSAEIVLKGNIHIPCSRRFQKKCVNTIFQREMSAPKNSIDKPKCTVHKLRLKAI